MTRGWNNSGLGRCPVWEDRVTGRRGKEHTVQVRCSEPKGHDGAHRQGVREFA